MLYVKKNVTIVVLCSSVLFALRHFYLLDEEELYCYKRRLSHAYLRVSGELYYQKDKRI